MKKNDVIVAYGDKEISDSALLRNQVADSPIAQDIKVTVLRNGQKEELTVKIGNLDSANKLLSSTARERLGISVRAFTAGERNKYKLTDNQGVVITRVDAKSAMGQAGFEVEDIILGINNHTIAGLDDFIAFISTLQPQQKITVLTVDHRTGNMSSVEVTVQ